MPVHIERIRRDIENINTFNATPHKGITRLTFSEAYQGAFAYIIGQLRKIGAHITICRGGTLKGMIFLPSKDGRSHCPEEFTRIGDIKLGCDILLATVIELAS